ncbi:hypothetical protein GCM10009839_87570 [Catenulispora yoronensis]|uniref:NACHT domain-containing protein n=1 Tax=Catenulispora yoronensis TaxID=450799 RepID=A0ABP5H519_9ACTN
MVGLIVLVGIVASTLLGLATNVASGRQTWPVLNLIRQHSWRATALLTTILGVVALLGPWLSSRMQAAKDGGAGGTVEQLQAAAASLRESSRISWTQEARMRSVSSVQLPPQWSLSTRPVQGTGVAIAQAPAEGGLEDLLEQLGSPPDRQLVILGEPGSGKTVLAMLLVLTWLERWQPGQPVPVLLPLSSYRPSSSLRQWMVARLLEDYPDLADVAAYGPNAAARLIDSNRVLPVFDGLDEISVTDRDEAISAIDSFIGAKPLILTCQGEKYQAAVNANGQHLPGALVIEMKKIQVDLAIAYLRKSVNDRWEQVFPRMRAEPEGPVAEALTTPLMIFLARIAYASPATDPELLKDQFHSREQVEDHLLRRFVPATYGSQRDPKYPADLAERWLRTLARRTQNLRW